MISKRISKKIFQDIYIPLMHTHKGQNGKVLIIGGSKDYFGAPLLAGMAAFKIVDKVGILSVTKVILKITYPEIIPYEIERDYLSYDDVDYALSISKGYDVVLLGSGISKEPITQDFINAFMKEFDGNMVVDADALKVMDYENMSFRDTVLTPNKNEYKYLEKHKKRIIEDSGIIVLKGKEDIVFSKEGTYINKTGNAGMTKAGTGDVLAGIVSAFFSKNNALTSACAGVYLNGIIGERLYKKKSYYYTPLDMIEEIPYALRYLISKRAP